MSEMLTREGGRWFTWRLVERVALSICWLVLVVLGVAGYFGQEDWRLELLVNFKMQYYLAALLLCAVAAWRRYHILLGMFLIVLGWNGWVIFNFAPENHGANGEVYRAISANVYTKNKQYARTEQWIREQEPDFVALIEITDDWKPTLASLSDILPYQRHQRWGSDYGAAVLSKYPPTRENRDYRYAGVGSLPMEVETPSGKLHLLLAHPISPITERAWKWRGSALTDIAKYAAAESANAPLLALGDFNTTPWSTYYADFVEQSKLSPIETNILPRRTWPTHNPLVWIPIDHFFVSSQLIPVRQWVGPNLGSDHYPIGLDFTFRPTGR